MIVKNICLNFYVTYYIHQTFRGRASSVIATKLHYITQVLQLNFLAQQMNDTLGLFLLNTHHSEDYNLLLTISLGRQVSILFRTRVD
jgi:hypothetical protein